MVLQVHAELRPYGSLPQRRQMVHFTGSKGPVCWAHSHCPAGPHAPPERRSGTLPGEPECCFRPPSISSSRPFPCLARATHLGWTCGLSLQACSFHIQKRFTLHLSHQPWPSAFLMKTCCLRLPCPQFPPLPPAGQRSHQLWILWRLRSPLGRGSFGLKG